MSVVCCGIGADTTNLGALGPLYDDGTFAYVPIPEKTERTSERETLGSWSLPDGRSAADLATRIRPRPVADPEFVVTGETLETWPLHHDPNFRSLTYGEHRTSGYATRLGALEPGDVVGFYAGLRRPGGERAHRYLIGYMTVETVDVVTPDADPVECARILDRHPDNAHTKRAREGRLYRDEKAVVLIDGREPGGLFCRHPIRLSEYTTKPGNQRPSYYLRSSVADRLRVVEGGESMAYKPAYRCALSRREFVSLVGIPGERTGPWVEE
ncbi:hypothetical protein [Halovivax gelatinilyticus]|uniref:Nmad3 family putative nucleotide modification protein n=1 Tax=Halovivax gelatinilyticus TaxID=2961597 RepID=UPI0020CA6E04|nr:hypothetical protein [Halovivax gelatinilyticus]